MEDAYRGQINEAAFKQRAGKPVNQAVYAEIALLQSRLAENAQSLAGLQAREENIRADFKKQLDRYRYLIETWDEESEGG